MVKNNLFRRIKYALAFVGLYLFGAIIIIPCGILWVITGNDYFDKYIEWVLSLDKKFKKW